MTGAMQVFDNGEFELSVTPVGDSFTVGAPGLARALGHRDAYRLVESIPGAEKGYTTACTPGGDQRAWFVTEAGFYRALGQRQTARIKDATARAQVQRFQDWVYRDVLPALRKTGRYEVAPLSRRELAEHWADAERRAEVAENRVVELEPSATAWDTLASATGDYSVRQAAYILNRDPKIRTGQNRLFKTLRDFGMVDANDVPYATHIEHVKLRPRKYEHPTTGEPKTSDQVRVTVAGLRYLHRRMGGGAPLRFDGPEQPELPEDAA